MRIHSYYLLAACIAGADHFWFFMPPPIPLSKSVGNPEPRNVPVRRVDGPYFLEEYSGALTVPLGRVYETDVTGM